MDMYRYILENKDAIFSKFDADITDSMYRKARSVWNELHDNDNDNMSIVGIDSSWNLIPYHGFYLYAVDAVSVLDEVVDSKYEFGIDTLEYEEEGRIIYNPSIMLSSKGMEFEYMLISNSINRFDLTLVDGSLQARIYDKRFKKSMQFYEYAKSILGYDNIAFISKRSESRSMLGGPAGDIYYFDNASNSIGYSEPYYDKGITIVYARLAEGSPCLKVEFPKKMDKDIIVDRLISIKNCSISGYPYPLTLAHEYCKISDKDMRNIEGLLGLEVNIKGREVLEL